MKTHLLFFSFILLSFNAYGDNRDIVIEIPKENFQKYSIKMVPSDNVKIPTIKYYNNDFGNKDSEIIHNPYRNNHYRESHFNFENFENSFNEMKKDFQLKMQESLNFHKNISNKIKEIAKENPSNLKYYSSNRSLKIKDPKNIGKNLKLEGENVSLEIGENLEVGDNVIFDNIGNCVLNQNVPSNTIVNLDNKINFCK